MKTYKLIDKKIINTLNNETIAEYKNNEETIIYNNKFSKQKIDKIFYFTNEKILFYSKLKILLILYTYLMELYKNIDIDKIKQKAEIMVDKILESKSDSYESILKNDNLSDKDKALSLLDIFYGSIKNYEKVPDDMDELKYKFEYYLFKYLSSGEEKENKHNNINLISTEIKKYSSTFFNDYFKFIYLEQFKNILNNEESSDVKKGELIQKLIKDYSLEEIELKTMIDKQVSKDGTFIYKTPCKWKYPKSDLNYYYPGNKCQCETVDGIKECNKSACS